jgi:hypothetical protein
MNSIDRLEGRAGCCLCGDVRGAVEVNEFCAYTWRPGCLLFTRRYELAAVVGSSGRIGPNLAWVRELACAYQVFSLYTEYVFRVNELVPYFFDAHQHSNANDQFASTTDLWYIPKACLPTIVIIFIF